MRTPAKSQLATPKATGLQRPPLPTNHINPYVQAFDTSKPLVVKFQEILRDGQATIVGRIKLQTPDGHAFILRRLDTGAISLTTMFRAAFPTASEDCERSEAAWVKLAFDMSNTNKSSKARFAGTWVPPEVALTLAESYHLSTIIAPLLEAVSEPEVIYRKSKAQQQPTPNASPVTYTPKDPHPAKRRRESSPASAAFSASAAPSPANNKIPLRQRSIRLKSPTRGVTPPASTPKTPRSLKAVREIIAQTPTASSDVTIVDEEYTEIVKVAEPNMQEDLREQQELIERLKTEKAIAEKAKVDAEASAAAVYEHLGAADETMETEVEESAAMKRAREEEPTGYTLNIQDPKEPENEERAVVTNSRIRTLAQLPPERKSLAWGAVFFAAGLGAMSLLPSIPSLAGYF